MKHDPNTIASVEKTRRPSPQQRLQAKKRLDDLRGRRREAKRQAKEGERKRVDGKIDMLQYYPLPLCDSEVRDLTKLADEEGVDTGEILLGFAWRRWVGSEGAKIIRNALRLYRLRRG